jgi:hypothetical protein
VRAAWSCWRLVLDSSRHFQGFLDGGTYATIDPPEPAKGDEIFVEQQARLGVALVAFRGYFPLLSIFVTLFSPDIFYA